jgi:acetylornithine/N-succinyldiaminopimelate aminotransferase
MNTYQQLPIAFTHGEGVYLYDTNNKRYLDGLGGIAVNVLGHAHPALIEAVTEQIKRIAHASNVFIIPEAMACAQKLVDLSGMDNVFFSNTGAEANECMIKMARKWGHEKGIEEPQIIVMENAFHGRTMGTLTASGSRKVQAGFEPLLSGFIRAPYNDLPALEAIAKRAHNVVAIMLEPLQGEGGMRVPSPDYLPGVRQLCDKQGWLMMLDEVQSGVGRTGQWFAYQHYDFKPDLMALAKGLAGGLCIGATLARGPVAQILQPGNHGSTFGGNPLSTRASLAVLHAIEKENLLENTRRVSDYFFKRLREDILPLNSVVDVRGQGLWLGIELDQPARPFQLKAAEHGLLFNVTAEKVIRFAPPLTFQEKHVDECIEILKKVL